MRHTLTVDDVKYNESFIAFSGQTLKFVKYVNEMNVNVFLIDPIILFKLIDDKHKHVLIERQLMSNTLLNDILNEEKKKFCISFAIFKNDFLLFNVSFIFCYKNL